MTPTNTAPVKIYSRSTINALSPVEQLIYKLAEKKGLVIIKDDREATCKC